VGLWRSLQPAGVLPGRGIAAPWRGATPQVAHHRTDASVQ
jgi:hypothetical protein